MNLKVVGLLQIAFALFCIIFGLDKFLEFLPTCSLVNHIPANGMIVIGCLEIIVGMVLLTKQYTLLSLRVATAMIIGGIIFHLATGTYDFGGGLIGAFIGLFLIYQYKRRDK